MKNNNFHCSTHQHENHYEQGKYNHLMVFGFC